MSFRSRELMMQLSGDDPKDPEHCKATKPHCEDSHPGCGATGSAHCTVQRPPDTEPTCNCGCGATGDNQTNFCQTEGCPKPNLTSSGHLAELRQQLRETLAGPRV